jgi:CPA2 family monovalent cation:H+ antiporter-2
VIIPVLAAVGMTVGLNIVAGQFVAWLNGLGPQAGINTTAILQNRGEFALILATLALAAGLDDRIQPFAGLYVLIMAIMGPILAVNSERIGDVVLGTTRKRARAAAAAAATAGLPAGAGGPDAARGSSGDLERDEAIALMEAATAGTAGGSTPGSAGRAGRASAGAAASDAGPGTEFETDRAAANAAGGDYDDYDRSLRDDEGADDPDLDLGDPATERLIEQAMLQSDDDGPRARDGEY